MNYPIPLVSSSDLSSYITTVQQIPHLSSEEEYNLSVSYYEHKDVRAAHKLVLSHLKLVVKIAKSLQGYNLPLSDLIQEGNVGLMKAVKIFNPYKGVRFSSYAMKAIKGEMYTFIINNWRIVKVATTKAKRKLFFNIKKYLQSDIKLTPTLTNQIASDLNVSHADVYEMFGRMNTISVECNTHDSNGDTDQNVRSTTVTLPANSPSPEEFYETESDSIDINDLINMLDERERDIIQSRWLTDNKSSLKQLSERHNVSMERIRQIETVALKKMRKTLES